MKISIKQRLLILASKNAILFFAFVFFVFPVLNFLVYAETPTFPTDFAGVQWLHTDISEWPATSNLSSIKVTAETVILTHNKTTIWPGSNEAETEAEVSSNPWIFVYQEGTWYAATWEWLRPNQITKYRYAVNGDHINKAPLDTFVPVPGETYYFMVSGLARFSARNVEERSNVVKIVWPEDGASASGGPIDDPGTTDPVDPTAPVDPPAETVPHNYIQSGDLESLQKYIDSGYYPLNYKDDDQNTMLHLALIFKQPAIVKYLVMAGVDLESKNNYDMPPLLLAAVYLDLESAKYLLDAGADVNATGFLSPDDGDVQSTALILACEVGDIEIVKLLIENGACLNYINKKGRTALFWAKKSENQEIIDYLESQGAIEDPAGNGNDPSGYTGAMPPNPSPTDPNDPGTTDPNDPGTVDPNDPGTTEPNDPQEPSEPDPNDPNDPADPGTSDPNTPGTVNPTDPGTTPGTSPGTNTGTPSTPPVVPPTPPVVEPVPPPEPPDPNSDPRIQGMIGVGLGKIKTLGNSLDPRYDKLQLPGGSSVHLNIKQVAMLLRAGFRRSKKR